MKINRPLMKEQILIQAMARPVEITDQQVENAMDEAEEMVTKNQKMMKKTPVEQQVIGAFMAGMLFGLDKCDPKKEDVIIIHAH